MSNKLDLISALHELVDTKEEGVNLYELIESFYNEAYNQGWSDCFWKSLKKK